MRHPSMRLSLLGSLWVAALLSTGCAAQRLIRHGDRSLREGQPIRAVAYYREALAKKESLADDSEFQAKWADARRQAAGAHHRRAVAMADEGKLPEARGELDLALEMDGGNAAARRALDFVTGKVSPADSPAQRRYAEAVALAAGKAWRQAGDILQAVIAEEPDHLPARSELHRCGEKLSLAEARFAAGQRLLAEKRLDEAAATFAEALDIWPMHPAAAGQLAGVKALRATFDGHVARAEAALQAGRWDEAIAAAREALGVYPAQSRPTALIAQARRKAADDLCRAGTLLLAGGQFDQAEANFRRALEYVPQAPAALAGLAQSAFGRGAAAEAAGRWGAALAWYADADALAHSRQHADSAARARERVRSRIAFTIDLKATDAALRARLQARLLRDRPPFVSLTHARDPAGPLLYRASVEAVTTDIRHRLVRTENRVHDYLVHTAVPNPEIPRLRGRLAAARADLAAMRAEYARLCRACGGRGTQRCDACRGAGRIRCDPCDGSGQVKCRRCDGDGKVHNDACDHCKGAGKVGCARCGGKGSIDCPKCRGGRAPCHRCHGRGRQTTITEADIAAQDRLVGQLARDLAVCPPHVRVAVSRRWPYIVCHHEKSGSATARLSVTHAQSGAVLAGRDFQQAAAYADTETRSANPDIGLPADVLVLPSDEEVRGAVLEALSGDIAAAILTAAVTRQADDLAARAADLLRARRNADAVETLADRAVLLEASDPAESRRLLDTIRKTLAAGQ